MKGHRHHDSQWAAQFAAAAQLSLRGYLVSLTLGHAPATDLLVESPKGTPFAIEVKGLLTPSGYWIVKAVPTDRPALWYIAVLHGLSPARSRYFILTPAEVTIARTAFATRGRALGGFQVADALAHEDTWAKLPA